LTPVGVGKEDAKEQYGGTALKTFLGWTRPSYFYPRNIIAFGRFFIAKMPFGSYDVGSEG
jgi:hypothetical protein